MSMETLRDSSARLRTIQTSDNDSERSDVKDDRIIDEEGHTFLIIASLSCARRTPRI
jgi:hypothetical protein